MRYGSLITATIRNDTWNVLKMQQHLKIWDYSVIPSGDHKDIKGHAHMVDGGHHLRKVPTPTQLIDYWLTTNIYDWTHLSTNSSSYIMFQYIMRE